MKLNNFPTIFIVFGATGDLMAKKIVPALYHLYKENKLPDHFKVIGFSRRDWSDADFQAQVLKSLEGHKDISVKMCEEFCKFFSYSQGNFDEAEGYESLKKFLKKNDDAWGLCSNKLFYLATSQSYYENIFKNLSSSGLTEPCSIEEGFTRVIVEKPFGMDVKSAEKLEILLSSLFKEVQIYRIDHYLAKEMIQNILAFRFSNNIFERTWDKNSIEKVEIKLWEKIGVEERGSFYDPLGTLRDVGQNHLLQIIALLAMEKPDNLSSEKIREKRREILSKLIVPSSEEIEKHTYRAQYEGYKDIKGVAPDSSTETYFKVRAYLSDENWYGVPFIIDSGKRMKEQIKEIVIHFKHPTPCLCPKDSGIHYNNKIIIALEPEEKITLVFWSKKLGLEFGLEERDFSFLMRASRKEAHYVEEYEKLLYDCIAGDQTLFVTSKEVESMWKYADPIVLAWQENKVPLKTYKPNTDAPIFESDFINKAEISAGNLKKEIGIIGLGKMGAGLARRLNDKGWKVYGYNKTYEVAKNMEKEGIFPVKTLEELREKMGDNGIYWLMVPAGVIFDEIVFGKGGLAESLKEGAVIIDGGNSLYKDTIRRADKLKKIGIDFIDVGVSGGPAGARNGPSLMIGGEEKIFKNLEILFKDLAKDDSYQFFEGAGAGHFVKMVHNGIEYGMMQALAEGFDILKTSDYKIDLLKATEIYNHGSVIESRLVGWLKDGLKIYGKDLDGVKGSVSYTGEGGWTVDTANELKVKAKVIEEAVKFRIESEKNPSFAGKILSTMRNQFGGHSIK